jgi:hypothetical protein
MKIRNLGFCCAISILALCGRVRAQSEPEVSVHDILTDRGGNFGIFQSVSANSMGEWLYVYRFVESEEPKNYRRYFAIGLRFHGGAWSGVALFRVVADGPVSREYRGDFSTSEATRFIAMIDSSEVFNLTGDNRTRIPMPGGNTLMGEELSKELSRSFIRGVNTSIPAQQVVHFMDTLMDQETRDKSGGAKQ